jgi:hypothetical protein
MEQEAKIMTESIFIYCAWYLVTRLGYIVLLAAICDRGLGEDQDASDLVFILPIIGDMAIAGLFILVAFIVPGVIFIGISKAALMSMRYIKKYMGITEASEICKEENSSIQSEFWSAFFDE